MRRRLQGLVVALTCCALSSYSQGPDASLQGVVTDSAGQPLDKVKITATNEQSGFTQGTETNARGQYGFASLPLGTYSLKAELAGHKGAVKQGIVLAVGDRKEESLALAPLSTPAERQGLKEIFAIVPSSPGLSVETVASSVSVVVDDSKILQLPLSTRNIYSLFLLQPGVTSQGAIARRGLSFAVHGQRVSGSNYLLDGVDNNDTALTGPVAAASAEVVQEFRMVNSSFSAEHGRATAFVAQVVTRAGGNLFHGSLYEFFANNKLDSNTFQNNATGVGKPSFHHNQFGYVVSGPLQRNRKFFTSALEYSPTHYGTPTTFDVPSPFYIGTLPAGEARRLLMEISPVASTPTAGDPNIGVARFEVPGRLNTLLATERFDQYSTNGKDRVMLRYTVSATNEQADLTPYPALRPTDNFRAHNTLLGWTHSFDAGEVNDLKLGWSRQRIVLPRPRNDVPIIQIGPNVSGPGSGRQLDQRENNNVIQISERFSVHRGRSALTAGFEYRRNLSNGITAGLENQAFGGVAVFPAGFYIFPDLKDFAQGRPLAFSISVDRLSSGQLLLPDLSRQYRSGDYAAFVQDDIKLHRRLSLNFGVRYDYFGVPHNVDRSRDLNFYFGAGSNIAERLANGMLRSTVGNKGDLEGLLYRCDRLNFAPSIGLAWDPRGTGRTVVRAGYALAFDRIFDAARDARSNSQQQVNCAPPSCTPSFQIPAASALPTLDQALGPGTVVQVDENLRTPYAENWYAGIQHNVTSSFLVELGHAGSVGRKLVSRDLINRSTSGARLNSSIFNDTFLSNAANSNYLGLEIGLRRRFSHGLQYQFSYTFSHAIDNQSDVLEGVRNGPQPGQVALATFTRQFDARVDRGNANFDQRQNLVFNAIWEVPGAGFRTGWPGKALRGWTVSVLGAYRTGFPLTIIIPGATPAGLRNNRVDFIGTASDEVLLPGPPSIAGGVQWLDKPFLRRATDHVGSLGRGALKGPGFWNYDAATLRNFVLKESLRLQFRAEFYNLFNHANLSTPVTDFAAAEFGQALYGLNRRPSRFGDLPLENPARRIQFGVRFQF